MQQAKTLLTILFAGSSCVVAAQEARDASAGIAACATIESAVARLDCFDELARRERAESAAAAPEPQAAPQSAPASTRAPAEPLPSRRDARAADRAEREVTSQVTAVREIQPGRIEVTLANGQVWRQTNTDPYELLVGHEVRVYPTGFGQYFRLSSKQRRSFIQVERVR